METEKSETPVANKRKVRGWDVVLRFLAVALSLTAALVLGLNKQTAVGPVFVSQTLPPLYVSVPAKWHYLSAFVFFVVANSIAFAYATISLILVLADRGENKSISLILILSDLVMVALLFSSIGASLAIGLMGYKGNTHVNWKKVCHVFNKFCDQAAAAIGLSCGAALMFFLLVILATLNLHKKH